MLLVLLCTAFPLHNKLRANPNTIRYLCGVCEGKLSACLLDESIKH